MPRRNGDYDVVYVSRPREVAYELPRRSATSRDYDTRPYVTQRRHETPRRHRDDYPRDAIMVSDLSEDYGTDAYYHPSRPFRDSYHPKCPINEERRGAQFAPEDRQRRRRSSGDNRRRPQSPDDYYSARGDRGRMDERRATPARRLQSAIRGSRDDSPEAKKRARARSVSFRETEATKHDVGNQKHERPGYEARAMGQYLRHDDDDDLASETYAIRRTARRYS